MIINKHYNEQPLFSKVIITLNKHEEEGSINLSDNVMSEFQYVIAKADGVKSVNVGDMIRVDIEKMTIKETNPNNTHEEITSVKLSPIKYQNKVFAIIEDRLIKTVFINQNLQTNE